MRIRKLITVFLLLSMIMTLSGCKLAKEWEFNDMTYVFFGGAHAMSLSAQGKEKEEIYVPYEINGKEVSHIGTDRPLGGAYYAYFYSKKLKKIYFPFSANVGSTAIHAGSCIIHLYEETYVFNTNNNSFVSSDYCDRIVVSNWAFNNFFAFDDRASYLKANISYMFNYADCPNEGYYSIDLITETGKLTPQPYEPPREGYTFGGWYKESECINEWNFETDEVIISFDEEGNRIYEEIKLYAKWIEK